MFCRISFLTFYFLIPFAALGQTVNEKNLHDYVNNLKIDNAIKGSLFSIKVVNAATEKTVFAHQPEIRLIPASIQKIVTTSLACTVLGSNYTFKTFLLHCGGVSADSVLNGNLYIRGGGDPTLGSPNFPETEPAVLFAKIKAILNNAGIAKINGKIIMDNSYCCYEFKTPETIHPSWEWEDIGSAYGAGLHGLNFHENFFSADIVCTTKDISAYGNYPHHKTLMPVTLDIKQTPEGSLPEIYSFSSPFGGDIIIKGTAPASGNSIKIDCAIQEPVKVFEYWLKDYLETAGIRISNNTYDTDTTQGLILLGAIQSLPLSQIAKYANYTSNNLFAEAIFSNMVREKSGRTTFADRQKAIEVFLNAFYSINTNAIHIVDGSGLSRQNYITADFMCDFLLKTMQYGFDLSLPFPGADKSTLKNFLANYPDKKNKIFLKSGSMTGVLNYAGYIINNKGEALCVTVMTNNFLCKTKEMRPKLERLIYLISEL